MNGISASWNSGGQSRSAARLMSGEVLKYVGFLLMLVDHANRYLLLGHPWMAQAGRFVFPIFAMVLGMGLRGASHVKLERLWWSLIGLGVVAELVALPLVWEGLRSHLELNVVFTMAAGCVFVWARVIEGAPGWIRWMAVCAGVAGSLFSEYGPVGAALVYAAYSMRPSLLLACLGWLSLSQLTLVPFGALVMVWGVSWWCGSRLVGSWRRMFGWLYVGQFAVFSALVLSA